MSEFVWNVWGELRAPLLRLAVNNPVSVWARDDLAPIVSNIAFSTPRKVPPPADHTESFSQRVPGANMPTTEHGLQNLFAFSTPFEFFVLVALPVSVSYLFVHHIFNNVFATVRLAMKILLAFTLAVYLRSWGEDFMTGSDAATEL